ncbi:MAG: FAD:protein FMN transferase [Bacteroidales bacterium]|nr:FAD:protein FMN transferase [Bacteroidales bacterium]
MGIPYFHHSFGSMGTVFDLIAHGLKNDEFSVLVQETEKEIKRIENLLSRFNTESEVSRINSLATQKRVYLTVEMYSIIKDCIRFYELTLGHFNIAAGTLAKKNEDSYLNILPITESIDLNENQKSILFKRNISLDFGGFGKGYALKNIETILDRYPNSNFFISFGESSILARGNHPNGEGWKIGIKDFFSDRILREITLHNTSVSLSGVTPNNKKTSFYH